MVWIFISDGRIIDFDKIEFIDWELNGNNLNYFISANESRWPILSIPIYEEFEKIGRVKRSEILDSEKKYIFNKSLSEDHIIKNHIAREFLNQIFDRISKAKAKSKDTTLNFYKEFDIKKEP